MNSEEDSRVNTELSVIDRFLLSQELDKDELVQETFTIFTSVSFYYVYEYSYYPDFGHLRLSVRAYFAPKK